jgi:DNA-binding NarL/FixJ family response regulator
MPARPLPQVTGTALKPGAAAAPAGAGQASLEQALAAAVLTLPVGTHKRVTLVDDDQSVHLSLARILESQSGWLLDYCSSGPEALSRIPENPPNLVLMDIVMSGPSGIECVRRLKLLFPGLPILMLTGSLASAHVLESLAAGAGGYLVKPVAAADLLDALRQAMTGALVLCAEARETLVEHLDRAGSGCALTPREREVATGLILGQAEDEIARRLAIEPCAVHSYIMHMFRRTNSHNRRQLIRRLVLETGVT